MKIINNPLVLTLIVSLAVSARLNSPHNGGRNLQLNIFDSDNVPSIIGDLVDTIGVGDAVDEFVDATNDLMGNLGNSPNTSNVTLESIVNKPQDIVSGVVEGATSATQDFISDLPFELNGTGLSDTAGDAVDVILGVGSEAINGVTGGNTYVDEIVDVTSETITNLINGKANEIPGMLLNEVVNATQSVVSGGVDTVQGFVGNVLDLNNSLADMAGDTVNGLLDVAGDAVNGLVSGNVNEVIPGVLNSTHDIVVGIVDTAQDVLTGAMNATPGILPDLPFSSNETGLVDTVGDAVEELVDTTSEVVSNIVGGNATDLLPENTLDGIVNATQEIIEEVVDATNTLLSSLNDTSGVLENIISSSDEIDNDTSGATGGEIIGDDANEEYSIHGNEINALQADNTSASNVLLISKLASMMSFALLHGAL